MQQICHRDLKLENTLLDDSPSPCLKICDFGYSKVGMINFVHLKPEPLINSGSLAVVGFPFSTQIDCWDTRLHRARGPLEKRVRWKGANKTTSFNYLLCSKCPHTSPFISNI